MKTIRPEGLACACVHCGALFQAWSPLTRYCSTGCRAKARRSRAILPAAPAPAAEPAAPAPVAAVTQPALSLPSGIEVRRWQGCPISRRAADGYVNATAMCQAGGKRWNHYMANDRTREYIAALHASLAQSDCGAAFAGNPATGYVDASGAARKGSAGNPADLVQTITAGPNNQRGTWIHPRLAVDLARWISPAFAVWMDGWFLESMATPAQPLLPSAGPAIFIRARDERQAAQIWSEAVEAAAAGAIRRRYSTLNRSDAPLSSAWQLVKG